MPIEFDIHITEKLLRQLMLRRLLRRWPRLLIAMALIGAGLVLDSGSGHWSAVSIMGVSAAVLLVAIFVAVYVRGTRAIAAWKTQQGDAPIHYSLEEAVVRARSNLGAMELKWTTFRELIEYQDCLLLCLSSTNHLTLPLADVPVAAVELIRQKFRELKLPIKRA